MHHVYFFGEKKGKERVYQIDSTIITKKNH